MAANQIVEKVQESRVKALRDLLNYIYPSLRAQIESSLSYTKGSRELVAVSSLIKTFAIAGQPQGVIHCLHYIVREFLHLVALDISCLRRAVGIEAQRISMLPAQLETLTRMSSGHDQYVLKLLGTYSATLVSYALHPEPTIPLADGEQLGTSYLGRVLESAITSTRLLLPAFVEQSGVYALIARLYHEDIHFAVEFMEKTAQSHNYVGNALQLVQTIADRYGITSTSPPPMHDPRVEGVHGYLRDPDTMFYVYTQIQTSNYNRGQ